MAKTNPIMAEVPVAKPSIPSVKNRILGEKFSIDLDEVLEKGLKNVIKDKKIFSYAITSKNKMKYTVFNPIK